MAGTREGGLKARDKNLAKDPLFYKRIGAKGGANGYGPNYQGGFAHPSADPSSAGYRGGTAAKKARARKAVAA